MTSLVHYGTDSIEINGRKYDFSDFLKIEPQYSAPWGFHTRVYKQGEAHYISDGSNTINLPKHDAYCDRICNREGELARLVALLDKEARGENS